MKKFISVFKYVLVLVVLLSAAIFGSRYGLVPFAKAAECPPEECQVQIPDVPTCLDANEQSIPIPDGQQADANGFCVDIDVCPNLDGNQATVPNGYIQSDKTGDCVAIPQSEPQVLGASVQSQLSNK